MSNIFDLFKQIEKKDTPAAGNLTHLVVGLGNPGDKYTFTRHNTGFMALDFIAEKCGVRGASRPFDEAADLHEFVR